MAVYLVRIINDKTIPERNCDLVGIFSTSSIHDLRDLVDECCDANTCEFTRLPRGGIMWSGRATPVPVHFINDDCDVKNDIPWKWASFTEDWLERFYSEKNKDRNRWHRLVPEDKIYLPGMELRDATDERAQEVRALMG